MKERFITLMLGLYEWLKPGPACELGLLSGIFVDPLRDDVVGSPAADPGQRMPTSISLLPGGPDRRATRKPTALRVRRTKPLAE